jgi:hypothetical protein
MEKSDRPIISFLPNVKSQTFRGLAHKAAQPRLGQSSKLSVVPGWAPWFSFRCSSKLNQLFCILELLFVVLKIGAMAHRDLFIHAS